MAQGTESWLKRDFVEKILRKSEEDNSIQVIDIASKEATSRGDNYASIMNRVSVTVSRERGGRKVTENLSIIFKIAQPEGYCREKVDEGGFFDKEILMLLNTLPKMNEFEGYIKPFNARGLYAQNKDPPLIVIEDLALKGFRMADRQAGLDRDHALLAIRSLARFHACSVALCEKHPEQKKLYTSGLYSRDKEVFSSIFIKGMKHFGEEIANWPEFGPRYSEKVLKFSEHTYRTAAEVFTLREDEFNVINHGDCWANNMLFRYDDYGKVIDHIFVDFQLSVYGSPAIDLVYFFNSNPSEEVYHNEMDMLVKEYRKTLSSTMARIGCQIEAPTLETLKKYMEEREVFGMIVAITALPLILLDKSESKHVNEMVDEDGKWSFNGYQGKAFRKVISRRMNKWFDKGLFEL